MKVIAVHPDAGRLRELTASIRAAHPDWKVDGFADQMLAVKHGCNNPVDGLYTFTRMRPMDGFAVARMMREQRPGIPVNFIGADDEDRTDAMRFGASGYITEPVTPEKLRVSEKEEW